MTAQSTPGKAVGVRSGAGTRFAERGEHIFKSLLDAIKALIACSSSNC